MVKANPSGGEPRVVRAISTRRGFVRWATTVPMTGVVGLAACGPLGQSVASDANLKPAKIEVWTHIGNQSNQEMLLDLAKGFMQTKPQITVDWTFVPPGSFKGLTDKLTVALAANTPPDATYMSPSFLDTLHRQNQTLQLDGLIGKSPDLNLKDFDKAAVEGGKFDGKIWGLPFSGLAGLITYYNKDLFAREGLAGPPRTWDELVTYAKKLTKVEGGTMTQMGFKGSATTAWAWNPFLWGNGGELYDRSGPVPKPIWNSPKAIDALQFYVDLVYKHQVWSITAEPSGGEKAGKVGMWLNAGGWVIPDYIKLPDLKWEAFRLPMRNGPKAVPQRIGADYLNMYKTEHQDATWAYLKYMTSTESLAKWATSWNSPPPRASSREHKIWKDYTAATPGMRALNEAMSDPENQPDPVSGFHGEDDAQGELKAQFAKAMKQEVTPRDALDEAAKQAMLVFDKLYKK